MVIIITDRSAITLLRHVMNLPFLVYICSAQSKNRYSCLAQRILILPHKTIPELLQRKVGIGQSENICPCTCICNYFFLYMAVNHMFANFIRI